jgi:N-acetylneuraminate synthase
MGNLNVLLEMVRQAASTGATYIKMQKKDVDTFYTSQKLNSAYKSPYGKTYGDYRRIFEFGKEDFDRFDAECRNNDIKWFATAQDTKSLEFLLDYNLGMYKVASCNADKREMLGDFASLIPTNSTVVVSVAGRTISEIESVLSIFNNHNVILNHCVAEYPCKNSSLKLGNISKMKSLWGSEKVKIGYSGHEEGVLPSVAASLLGAEIIERHFCLSRDSFVHHIECSLEPKEFKLMVDSINKGTYTLNDEHMQGLGKEAFESSFGMSDMEKSFLLDNKYGNDYLAPRL